MTPQQALANLYQASILAPLTAEQHKIMAKSAQLLDSIIKKPEVKTDEVIKVGEPLNVK